MLVNGGVKFVSKAMVWLAYLRSRSEADATLSGTETGKNIQQGQNWQFRRRWVMHVNRGSIRVDGSG